MKTIPELRSDFEKIATQKHYIMKRNSYGEYISAPTFQLWAGYWECAVFHKITLDILEEMHT